MIKSTGRVTSRGGSRIYAGMKFLRDPTVLLSAAELGDSVGIDLETVNNWIRRGIISRAPIGGRQLRYRLFSTEEVYKTALKNELVKLGIPPSSASNAVNEFWKEWDKKESPEGRIYAVLEPRDGKWTALLCWQKISGGPLTRLANRQLRLSCRSKRSPCYRSRLCLRVSRTNWGDC